MSQEIKISAKVKENILKDYRDGLPMKEVAQKYKVSMTTVGKYAVKAGLGRKRYWTNEEIERAIQLYESGTLIEEIGKQLGRHRLDVSEKIRKNGVKTIHGSIRTQRIKNNPFENLKDPETQYWLGWLASDGCITEKGQVILTICKDPEMLDKYITFLGVDVPILKQKQTTSTNLKYCVEFSSQEVAQFLINLGITPRKSLILKMNVKLTWDFIRGYLDGNGQLDQGATTSALIWHTASINFAEQLMTFFNAKNMKYKLYTNKRENPCYSITVRNIDRSIIRKLYPPNCIFIARKRPKILYKIANDIV